MEENTNNGMNNAMWGNASWGNTPPWGWGQQKNGPSGTDIAALTLGIVGTGLGLMSGGLGIFNNRNGNPNGQQGGPAFDRIAALEAEVGNLKADVAVNTQRDIDLAENNKLMIENAKLQAKLDIKESEQKLTGLITMVNNQVIVNQQKIACIENDFNKLIQIGIPSSNIIAPPAAATTSCTAGA